MLPLTFTIAAQVAVASYIADVREARVYRLQGLKLAMQDWALEGETKFTCRYKKSDATDR